MDSYDSEQRLILQGFSRSTRFAFFCTALNSENLQFFVKMLLIFAEILQKIGKILRKSAKIRKQKMHKSVNFAFGEAQKNANLVDFEKVLTLQNEPLVAIVAVHTAENEPSEVC